MGLEAIPNIDGGENDTTGIPTQHRTSCSYTMLNHPSNHKFKLMGYGKCTNTFNPYTLSVSVSLCLYKLKEVGEFCYLIDPKLEQQVEEWMPMPNHLRKRR